MDLCDIVKVTELIQWMVRQEFIDGFLSVPSKCSSGEVGLKN